MLLTLFAACSSQPATEPAPVAPAPTPKSPVAPAKDPAPAERVSIPQCNEPVVLDLWPARAAPRDALDLEIVAHRKVGPLVAGKPVSIDAMLDYGWLGRRVSSESDGPGWFWFAASSDLTAAKLVETYGSGFSCESWGGDGQITTDDRDRVTSVTLRDERFRVKEPSVGIGSAIDQVRPWFCASACDEQPDLLSGQNWLVDSAVGTAVFDGKQGHLIELTVDLGGEHKSKAKAGKKKAKAH
ncbi:MAG: hypothetical protein H6735_32715 [Alphaproteobacteria bacterium]|nr:hypothetical protein [Alphaproteobacteria bacterium]